MDATAAGGSYPRHFSINKAGDMVAVALQMSGNVVIWERNVTTGKIVREIGIGGIAQAWGLGNVTCVVWDE
jgi:6-phosphogluconolactonase (cycloisomerase 2 family)